MAYSASGLTRLAGGSGVSLWHYTTTDAAATVDAANYVNAASATAVDVTDGTTVSATDSR